MVKDLKITEVLEIQETRYFAKITFQKLKELVDSGCININLSEDIPYVPLEQGTEITLGINTQKSSLSYNKDRKELILEDSKFDVIEGRIRLINFIKNEKDTTPKGEINLHIISYNTEDMPNSYK